jgi:hypothetical protein
MRTTPINPSRAVHALDRPKTFVACEQVKGSDGGEIHFAKLKKKEAGAQGNHIVIKPCRRLTAWHLSMSFSRNAWERCSRAPKPKSEIADCQIIGNVCEYVHRSTFVNIENVVTWDLARRLHHRQYARPNRRRQRIPCLRHKLELRIAGRALGSVRSPCRDFRCLVVSRRLRRNTRKLKCFAARCLVMTSHDGMLILVP